MATKRLVDKTFSLGAYVDNDGSVKIIAYGGKNVKEWHPYFNKYLKSAFAASNLIKFISDHQRK
ncbi:hypothetical protein [Megasphaera sueciensis]|uniref:hypothetical protein n=1 Tax=Megasphaera sueciensis TaxID=349094 RepID=UPI003D05CC97